MMQISPNRTELRPLGRSGTWAVWAQIGTVDEAGLAELRDKVAWAATVPDDYVAVLVGLWQQAVREQQPFAEVCAQEIARIDGQIGQVNSPG